MRAVSAILAYLVVVSPSAAQRLPPPLPRAASASRSTPGERRAPGSASKPQPTSPAGAIVGSTLGTGAGVVLAGGFWYVACYEECGDNAGGIVALGLLGESLLASFGTHLGNSFAGNYLLDLAVAGGIAAVGGAATAATDSAHSGAVLVSAAVVQVVALVLVERAKGARRVQRAATEAS